jgi:hypothetical protein
MTRGTTTIVALAASLALTGVVASLALPGAAASFDARSSARPLELAFVGWHEPDPKSAAGFSHAGTFTASGALCSSGRMVTTEVTNARAIRLLSCDDGSGTVSAVVFSPQNEHGGSGSWQIVSGTGAYQKIRGHGSYTSVPTGGDPSNEVSITFRSSWSGIADLDDVAPEIGIARASAARLPGRARAYSVRLGLTLRDDVAGNPVSYTLRVTAGGLELSRRFGTATTPSVPLTLRITPRARVKVVQLHLAAEDPVGNGQFLSRSLRLPK